MAKKEQPFNNPFGGLKLSAEPRKKAEVKVPVSAPAPVSRREVDADAALFLDAVGEVAPLKSTKARVGPPPPPAAHELRLADEEAESLAALAELVAGDGEFDLSDSDEFIEGAVQGFDERVMRQLRRGDFSVRAHVDLHGMKRDEAKEALERFLQSARTAGHRCVLVITGRGLHSKDQVPVIKQGVQQWLTRGRFARQVLAFCSARPKDGGTGAIYVLLRR